MATLDENQHWVPKFLVKSFADFDGRVFCLNTQTDEVTKPPPRRAASSAGFNEFRIGSTSISFEDRLERIETFAAPILKQIVKSQSASWLSEIQRKRVGDFIATQSFRTDAFRKGLSSQSPRTNFGVAFFNLWRSAFLVSAEIVKRRWAVMIIVHDDVFYLGDHPVVLQHTERPASDAELGFDLKGVEAYMPLTPKCALYMPCVSTCQEIISGYEKALAILGDIPPAEDEAIGNIAEVIELSQRIVQNNSEIYRALKSETALVALPENVENLNYLQCSWSHRSVYSNCRDFTFAKKVFRESPQYRSTVKVRLAAVWN